MCFVLRGNQSGLSHKAHSTPAFGLRQLLGPAAVVFDAPGRAIRIGEMHWVLQFHLPVSIPKIKKISEHPV